MAVSKKEAEREIESKQVIFETLAQLSSFPDELLTATHWSHPDKKRVSIYNFLTMQFPTQNDLDQ
jgi:hypothetical protein